MKKEEIFYKNVQIFVFKLFGFGYRFEYAGIEYLNFYFEKDVAISAAKAHIDEIKDKEKNVKHR